MRFAAAATFFAFASFAYSAPILTNVVPSGPAQVSRLSGRDNPLDAVIASLESLLTPGGSPINGLPGSKWHSYQYRHQTAFAWEASEGTSMVIRKIIDTFLVRFHCVIFPVAWLWIFQSVWRSTIERWTLYPKYFPQFFSGLSQLWLIYPLRCFQTYTRSRPIHTNYIQFWTISEPTTSYLSYFRRPRTFRVVLIFCP